MRLVEEAAARRSMKLNGCVDALLAAVVDRNGSSPNSSSLSANSPLEGALSPVIVPSSALYPDLVVAANERRKVMKVTFLTFIEFSTSYLMHTSSFD